MKKAVHDLLHNDAYYDYLALKNVAAQMRLASNDSTALKLAAAKMALASSDGVRCPLGMRTHKHMTFSRVHEQTRTRTASRLSYLGAGRNAVLSGVVEWTEIHPNEMGARIGLLLGNIDDECALPPRFALSYRARDSVLAAQAGAEKDELGPACRSMAARTRQPH